MKIGFAFKQLRKSLTKLKYDDICRFRDKDGNRLLCLSTIYKFEEGLNSIRFETLFEIIEQIPEFTMHDLIDLIESE